MNSKLSLPGKNLKMQKRRWKPTRMMLTRAHYRVDGQLCQHWRTNWQTSRGSLQIWCQVKKWVKSLLTRLGLSRMITSRRDQAFDMEMSLM
ncbi:nonstructral protein [Orthohantavirus tulaense]|uniref:Non-structural protein NS-S n=1 Tax=Tula orthohantavirus TaxID=3052503 RepID=NSS_TULV|nr:nonstructral protein [Orthohantavirus tulaense]P0DTK1.1 RecName: Full=Non-structural protein NS-S; Short=NSs [Orthohantavirus tulaense]